MTYVAPAGLHGYSDIATETYAMDGNHPGQHHYQVSATSGMQDAAKVAFYNQNMSCDIKPRLTKEQHDLLEAEFQKQSKPNTNTKKGFADALNVSLDKVNNWFQNRRAKSKQDAKKQAGTYSIFAQQHVNGLVNYDSDTSPSFASPDYFSMMQQCGPDDQMPDGLGISQVHHFQEQAYPHGLAFGNDANSASGLSQGPMPQQSSHDMFDSPLDMNRRTLTQEQFDAFAHNGGIMQSSGQFDSLHHGFSGDADILQQVFPEMHQNEPKRHDGFAFATPVSASMSSNDSSVPSSISEQSGFPPSTAMRDQMASNFTDSRSSALSTSQGQSMFFGQMQVPQSQGGATTSQWQPGQSVPVDPNALQQHFREVEQRQMLQHQHVEQQHQQSQPPQQGQEQEQPRAWPADEAYVHSDSQNGVMLAQQMSSFAIQTPQPQESAAFKAPAPPSSIAARRQRPRPAQLGLASLRSQSYSGAVQSGSPGHVQQQSLTPGLPLRRIRSSNVINSVVNGRVMKTVQGPQRSPLNWTFADGVNSPNIVRNATSCSMGNLAPPTPLSPGEMQAQAQEQQQTRPPLQTWQSSTGVIHRPASISETNVEHHVPYMQSASVPQQNFTSPPHTPMYQQHPQQQQQQYLVHSHPPGNVILENTPPQSAPAAQQTFPKNVFMPPQQYNHTPIQAQPHPQQQQQQPFQAQQMQAMVPSQPQQMTHVSMPESQQHASTVVYSNGQQFVMPMTPAASDSMQFQFANGVPVVNAQGQLTMAFPQQQILQAPPAPAPAMQFVQHAVPQGFVQQHTPPQTHYSFVTSDGISPAVSAQMQKPAPPAELFVHEYSPPQDVKHNATPRKALDTGPKNYTFANQGPEHFERTKKGVDSKTASVASSSPASSATGSGMS